MNPISDIEAAVAVLNEHRFRDCDSWYVYEANGISMINGNGTFLSVGAEENAIAIANSLVLAERCAELEAKQIKLWECPACGFGFDARHEDEGGGYSCPSCRQDELEAELAKYKKLSEPVWP